MALKNKDKSEDYLKLMLSVGLKAAAGMGLLGWVAGFLYAAYSEPCINEPNKYAVEACAAFSGAPFKLAMTFAMVGFFGGAVEKNAQLSNSEKSMIAAKN